VYYPSFASPSVKIPSGFCSPNSEAQTKLDNVFPLRLALSCGFVIFTDKPLPAADLSEITSQHEQFTLILKRAYFEVKEHVSLLDAKQTL